jgi:hypothetical protein
MPATRSLFSRWVLITLAIAGADARADVLDPLDFASLGTLNLSGGNFTIDTDALTIVDDAAPGTPLFTGVVDDQGGLSQPGVVPEIAAFAFDAINLDPSASVTITGTRAVALLSHTDATIGTALSVDGKSSGTMNTDGGAGPGGFAGGAIPTTSVPGLPGEGPGGGQPNVNPDPSIQFSGGMGGFGGAGVEFDSSSGPPGQPYGDLTQLLQGGSGGASHQTGGGTYTGGAGGGGAIELAAVGTLRLQAPISARGGFGETFFFGTAGSGSGGGIRISGSDVVLDALLSAPGGDNDLGGRSGGGGRVLIRGGPGIMSLDVLESAELLIANIDVKSTTGAYNSNPVAPTVSRANQGVITLSPNLTLVSDGETLPLGQAVDLSTPTENIELMHRNARFAVGATGDVGSGYTSQYLIELTHPTATIIGSGTLTNEAELRGTGAIDVDVTNAAGGQINATNDSLSFTQAVTNDDGAQINAINSTIDFQAGLTNHGQLNLINTSILGSINGGAGGGASFVGNNTVAGNLVMTAGDSLAIRLGGTAPIQFDSLAVSGNATLAGSLSVSLTGGFTIEPDQSFTIVDIAGAAAGSFVGLAEGAAVGSFGGTDLFITYAGGNGNDVALFTLAATLPGDFNQDGAVDAADYVVWRKSGGPPGEYETWRSHFGQGTSSATIGAGLQSVTPEPATLSIVGTALLLILAHRRPHLRMPTSSQQ